MIEGVLIEGLIYGILALGIFITFRVLDFPDLTVEGSFPFGAAVGGALIVSRFPTPLALVAGFLAGSLAGAVTSAIHHGLRVPPMLAGIVTMTGIYSVNLRVLGGKANLPLIAYNPVMRAAESWLGGAIAPSWQSFLAFSLIAMALIVVLDLFFHTEVGIAMGALGDNETSVISAGVDPVGLRTFGIALSNGLSGLAGAFAASYQGFADANFGVGIVASGLASVMIGEFLFRSNRIGGQLARVILGSILFRGLMYAGRSWGYLAGITPNDLRLLTSVLIVASIAASRYKGYVRPHKEKP
jgi:putative ABC transport system permease protein